MSDRYESIKMVKIFILVGNVECAESKKNHRLLFTEMG